MWSDIKQVFSMLLAITMLLSSLFVTGSLPAGGVTEIEPGEYTQWVNPFVGTGGYPWVSGMLFPGATSPLGLVRLSPDTCFPVGFDPFDMGNAGYWYGHNYLLGFSHTRLAGTGARDLGSFRVTPAVGDTDPADRNTKPIMFSHTLEEATAGYYSVNLQSINCLVELTTAQHTGVHRYTFSSDKDAHLFIDATSYLGDNHAENGYIKYNPETGEIEGGATVFTAFSGRYGGLRGYFIARLDAPVKSYSTWIDGESVEGRAESSGNDTGINLNLGNVNAKPVTLKVGISFVSPENARENLDAEAGELDFDGVLSAATADWDSTLSRIKIESDDPEVMSVFYTSLYHSFIMPTNFTDVNGEYLGFNGQIGVAQDFTYRTDMSLWDTVRTTHPLYTLIAPEVQRDCLKSLVRMARIGGTLPRWPSGGGYTGSMFGTPADIVIAESYLKGFTDFEVEEAYEYMKKTSDELITTGADGRNAVEEYNSYGYCPADVTKRSVAYTLEYAWADSAIASLAEALGKTDEASRYAAKAQYYKNVFNPATKYFQGRNTDGSWDLFFEPDITTYYDELLPVKFADEYCEGSARQWRWSVQQDPQGLIELFGDTDYFVSELNTFMEDATVDRAALNPGSGYWHGNQPDIHAAYLFNEAGREDLTQKWVRWILSERYSTDSDGIDGNDDGGTLSAWYVLSALGIYPVAGTSRYWIGSPIVGNARVNLGNGCTLSVIAENQSADNIYVQQVTLNGERLTEPSVLHSQLINGGTLCFTMGSEPAENGGF